MNKTAFKKLIDDNRDKFVCLTLEDFTIRRDYPHTALCIVWNTGIGRKTVLKTMRGKSTDLKCKEELSKYQKWMQS